MRSTKLAIVSVLFVAGITVVANAQTTVFVPGTASGCFGNDAGGVCVPFVAALTVNGPGTVTVTYVSGAVIWDLYGDTADPNGVVCTWCQDGQPPLDESRGIAQQKIKRLAALIGVFVPQSRVQHSGFQAIDGTKNAAPVGIMPGGLFFIGTGKTIEVTQAGTLFLGINDWWVGDNGGGFTVEVTGP